MAYCDDDIISPTTTQPIPQKTRSERSGNGGGGGIGIGGEGREGRGGGGGGTGGGNNKLNEHDALQNKKEPKCEFYY